MLAKQQTASSALGQFSSNARWEDYPDSVRHTAKRSLLNGVATALGSARDPVVETLARTLRCFAGADQAALIGRGERMDAPSTAFVNAVAINLLDFDDTHLPTVIHPTAPVMPTALALGEWRNLSGRQVLEAFVAGAEIECRIGLAVSPGHYARGAHITSTCGVFGAAAAAAKLLGLRADQVADALGIAASLSSGLVENLPTAAKNAGVGNAARNGILAAVLAEAGQAAAPTAIEGPLGWARAGGNELNMAALTGDLGVRWEFARNTFKPYPCGIVMHAVIDACLDLRATYDLRANDIAAVTVSGDALLLARGDRAVANARDARVSIHHCAGVALLFGAAGVREFSDAVVFDPDVVALRAKVKAERDNTMPVGAAKVTVALTNGQTVSATVVNARGSLERPLSDAEIEAKLRGLARDGSPHCDADRVIEAVWTLDEKAGLSRLTAALAG
ncbi:MmgE/PrpD family protein [Limobrevibacterium gyesilva]|uniref:MmgE/PrpD family protein n=1 Tax=Limobrevibacterium gyesilva TaxID=2991712 RepID=A0AA41YJC3_9PROT|nr:MmgE/PrpD family protein [Limobrevibacterium gyesilva]MCW3474764.1 MmgE/PrpD family protein [Limobrevibacterium gyesilva]